MINKWGFDTECLKRYIELGNLKINSYNISSCSIKSIKRDIKILGDFLSNNYEFPSNKNESYTSIVSLKEIVLEKMQKEYDLIGEDFITFLMDLCYEGIFEDNISFEAKEVPIDIQEEFTLKNYEKNAKGWYEHVKRILSPVPTKQIQLVNGLDSSSWCHFSEIGNHSFIIINPTDSAHALNHEIQHGIDFEQNFLNIKNYFIELNSIFFELTFDDLLFDKKGICDHSFRLQDIAYWLDNLRLYFSVMKSFKKKNFDVSLYDFLKTISDTFNLDAIQIIPFLNETIINGEFDCNLTYAVSFLKAVELREQKRKTRSDNICVLEPYISSEKFDFNPNYKSFEIYKTFVQEANDKKLRKSI